MIPQKNTSNWGSNLVFYATEKSTPQIWISTFLHKRDIKPSFSLNALLTSNFLFPLKKTLLTFLTSQFSCSFWRWMPPLKASCRSLVLLLLESAQIFLIVLGYRKLFIFISTVKKWRTKFNRFWHRIEIELVQFIYGLEYRLNFSWLTSSIDLSGAGFYKKAALLPVPRLGTRTWATS